MQKIVATFIASLVLFPAGSFAQEFGELHIATASTPSAVKPLTTSAVRAALTLSGPAVQEPKAKERFTARDSLQTQRRRSWLARHPVMTGALIGFGVGTTLGVIAMKQEHYPLVFALPYGAAMSAAGAAIGVAIDRRHP